jgi:antitoxin VapB
MPGDSQLEALAIEEETEAVRTRKWDLKRFLEAHIWPAIPANVLGREVAKEEIEDYLGFGPGGV